MVFGNDMDITYYNKTKLLGYIDIHRDIRLELHFLINNPIGSCHSYWPVHGNCGFGTLIHVGEIDRQRLPHLEFIPGSTELGIAISTEGFWNDGVTSGARVKLDLHKIYNFCFS